ncbi:Uncharacterised protein [Staphylococcus gallinarum]|uniref:Uncharacterized protein n=1 Tax=Staphylococcus gallinarum TaxID=1293 RepID=A0A380FDS4_STAGA|nr:Uncharacterised protein [Staphylococcus gallinarum]
MKNLLKQKNSKNFKFVFAAVALNHDHIYGMCEGLIEAGATLKWVFDSNPKRIKEFTYKFPEVKIANSLHEILNDKEVQLVAAADIPAKRSDLGNKVMKAGKDYFYRQNTIYFSTTVRRNKKNCSRNKTKNIWFILVNGYM